MPPKKKKDQPSSQNKNKAANSPPDAEAKLVRIEGLGTVGLVRRRQSGRKHERDAEQEKELSKLASPGKKHQTESIEVQAIMQNISNNTTEQNDGSLSYKFQPEAKRQWLNYQLTALLEFAFESFDVIQLREFVRTLSPQSHTKFLRAEKAFEVQYSVVPEPGAMMNNAVAAWKRAQHRTDLQLIYLPSWFLDPSANQDSVMADAKDQKSANLLDDELEAIAKITDMYRQKLFQQAVSDAKTNDVKKRESAERENYFTFTAFLAADIMEQQQNIFPGFSGDELVALKTFFYSRLHAFRCHGLLDTAFLKEYNSFVFLTKGDVAELAPSLAKLRLLSSTWTRFDFMRLRKQIDLKEDENATPIGDEDIKMIVEDLSAYIFPNGPKFIRKPHSVDFQQGLIWQLLHQPTRYLFRPYVPALSTAKNCINVKKEQITVKQENKADNNTALVLRSDVNRISLLIWSGTTGDDGTEVKEEKEADISIRSQVLHSYINSHASSIDKPERVDNADQFYEQQARHFRQNWYSDVDQVPADEGNQINLASLPADLKQILQPLIENDDEELPSLEQGNSRAVPMDVGSGQAPRNDQPPENKQPANASSLPVNAKINDEEPLNFSELDLCRIELDRERKRTSEMTQEYQILEHEHQEQIDSLQKKLEDTKQALDRTITDCKTGDSNSTSVKQKMIVFLKEENRVQKDEIKELKEALSKKQAELKASEEKRRTATDSKSEQKIRKLKGVIETKNTALDTAEKSRIATNLRLEEKEKQLQQSNTDLKDAKENLKTMSDERDAQKIKLDHNEELTREATDNLVAALYGANSVESKQKMALFVNKAPTYALGVLTKLVAEKIGALKAILQTCEEERKQRVDTDAKRLVDEKALKEELSLCQKDSKEKVEEIKKLKELQAEEGKKHNDALDLLKKSLKERDEQKAEDVKVVGALGQELIDTQEQKARAEEAEEKLKTELEEAEEKLIDGAEQITELETKLKEMEKQVKEASDKLVQADAQRGQDRKGDGDPSTPPIPYMGILFHNADLLYSLVDGSWPPRERRSNDDRIALGRTDFIQFIQEWENARKAREARVSELDAKILRLTNELKQGEEKFAALEKDLRVENGRIADKGRGIENELQATKNSNANLSKELDDHRRALKARNSDYALLQEQIKNFQANLPAENKQKSVMWSDGSLASFDSFAAVGLELVYLAAQSMDSGSNVHVIILLHLKRMYELLLSKASDRTEEADEKCSVNDQLRTQAAASLQKLHPPFAQILYQMCQERIFGRVLIEAMGRHFLPGFPLIDQVLVLFATDTETDLTVYVTAVALVYLTLAQKMFPRPEHRLDVKSNARPVIDYEGVLREFGSKRSVLAPQVLKQVDKVKTHIKNVASAYSSQNAEAVQAFALQRNAGRLLGKREWDALLKYQREPLSFNPSQFLPPLNKVTLPRPQFERDRNEELENLYKYFGRFHAANFIDLFLPLLQMEKASA